MALKYVSNGDWFDRGTEAKLLVDCSPPEQPKMMGLFRGIRNGDFDEEICPFDEFQEIEEAA